MGGNFRDLVCSVCYTFCRYITCKASHEEGEEISIVGMLYFLSRAWQQVCSSYQDGAYGKSGRNVISLSKIQYKLICMYSPVEFSECESYDVFRVTVPKI